MGLFNLFKSKPVLPAQADDIFNQLSGALDREGDASARHRLWTAVFALKEWHFLNLGMRGAAAKVPMATTDHDRSCVVAFTSRQRAEIAAHHYNTATAALDVDITSLPRAFALEQRICLLPRSTPDFVLFNAGTGGNGFAETIQSIVAMSDFFLDELPECGLHHLAAMASKAPDAAPLKRLVRGLHKLPHWHFISDADNPDVPQVVTDNDLPHFTLFTSPQRVTDGVVSLGADERNKFFHLAPASAAARLADVWERSGRRINHVLVNSGWRPFPLPIQALISA